MLLDRFDLQLRNCMVIMMGARVRGLRSFATSCSSTMRDVYRIREDSEVLEVCCRVVRRGTGLGAAIISAEDLVGLKVSLYSRSHSNVDGEMFVSLAAQRAFFISKIVILLLIGKLGKGLVTIQVLNYSLPLLLGSSIRTRSRSIHPSIHPSGGEDQNRMRQTPHTALITKELSHGIVTLKRIMCTIIRKRSRI